MGLTIHAASYSRYSVRSVLEPFDRQFNAITGLNGSGKSNVLDGICFVLGITNLSKVRAGNLSELVYKQGQAGITKASVTVVFNNADRSRSPVGFESFEKITVSRQIVIGGRNRYLLNGKTAQLQEIYNLFHSVQLNINNPHFLIMQGSITKVINMKPQEILGMIEEAAGTSMYESKKTIAIRTLDKKQLKVDEIDRIIKEEIEPQLHKLKEEKRAFLEWSDMVKQADQLEHFVISWDYRNVAGKLAGGGGQYDQTATDLKNWKNAQKSFEASAAKMEDRAKTDVKSLEKQRAAQEESERSLHEDIQALQRKHGETKAIIKEKSATLKSNTGRQLKSKSQEAKLEKDIETKKLDLAVAETEFEAAKSRLVETDSQLEIKQKLVSDLNAGGVGAGSSGHSLQQELNVKKSSLEETTTEIKTVGIKIKGAEAQLKQLKARDSKAANSEYEKMMQERLALVERKSELEGKISDINYNPQRFQQVSDLVRTNERKIESLFEQRNQLNSGISQRLSFDVLGYDSSKIKGMVAKLIHVKPEYGEKYLKALEILAGGKLWNVVVDSEKTSREILESGKLKKRTTLLPLDKIQGKKVTDIQLKEALAIAKKIGGEAVPAIETLAFVDELCGAIEYVFGNTFVCDNDEIGQKITFNKSLPENQRHRTVTCDGDVYDPKGSLTGGSEDGGRNNGRVLASVYELQKVVYDLSELQEATAKLQGEKQRMLSFKDQSEVTTKEMNNIIHSLKVLDSRLKSTSQSQLAEEISVVEDVIKTSQERLAELEKLKNELSSDIEKIQKEIADITKNKEAKIKSATADVTALKKSKKTAADDVKAAESKRDQLAVAVKSAEEELKSFHDDLSNQSAQSSALEAELATLEEKSQSIKDQIESLQSKLKEVKVFISSFDRSIKDVYEAVEQEKSKLDEADINVKKFESLMAQLEKERREAKTEVERMEGDHSWLRQARNDIMSDESIVRATSSEIEKKRNKLQDIKDEVNIRGKSINRRIIPLIERNEKDADDLSLKREHLEKEKKAIHEFIHELDEKKGRALSKTWQIVNANFGAIFRSLLPNVDAKLAPPEGLSALEGLELKVQLGSVWKDSLTELSGGQKSLLALSLVLALLLFKPAPFYILDEVDAALDVSHTRNIGKMIKQHFPHSQFIIVSLKDGMFSNANVLFRVRFENGTSVVSRTEQQSAARGNELDAPTIDYKPIEFVEQEVPVKKAVEKKAAKSAVAAKKGKKRAAVTSSDDENIAENDSDEPENAAVKPRGTRTRAVKN